MDVISSGNCRETRETCIIEYSVHRVESRKEACFTRSGHFVRYAWFSEFGAYDAVVGRIEAKLYNLYPSQYLFGNLLLRYEKKYSADIASTGTYVADASPYDIRFKFVVC
jgi:hypothetical protein